MDFPIEFFHDEVREGFYVSSIMKRAWAAQIEVLLFVDEICKKHGMKWFADFGTLLGAVRHKGFIPWDDDIDICMLREDYNRFMQIMEEELPEEWVFITPYNSTRTDFQLFARITNTKFYTNDDEKLKKYHYFPLSAGIDIFPMDKISDNIEEENARYTILNELRKAAVLSDQGINDFSDLVNIAEELTGYIVDKSLDMKQQIYICIDQVGQIYDDIDSEYVTCIGYYLGNKNYKCKYSCYSDIEKLSFELIELNCPIGYEEVLRFEFGDYHKIVISGGDHDYPYFEQNFEQIDTKTGSMRFNYQVNTSDLVKTKEKQDNYYRNAISKYVETSNKVIRLVKKQVFDNDFENAVVMLENIQKMTIDIGESIEKRIGDQSIPIRILEEFCEIIYMVAQNIEEVKPEDISELSKCVDSFKQSLVEYENDYEEVVFLCFGDKYWTSFEKYYKEMVEKGYHVTVIDLPYYEVLPSGLLGEFHETKGNFSKNIEITSYGKYDFEKIHPDRIFIQSPYDEYNRVISIPPYFYSSNLMGFTNELIYVSPYEISEIESAKQSQTLKYFCGMPGVVNADVVYVKSDGIRQTYIDYLVKMSGEEYRSVWEEKIKVTSL